MGGGGCDLQAVVPGVHVGLPKHVTRHTSHVTRHATPYILVNEKGRRGDVATASSRMQQRPSAHVARVHVGAAGDKSVQKPEALEGETLSHFHTSQVAKLHVNADYQSHAIALHPPPTQPPPTPPPTLHPPSNLVCPAAAASHTLRPRPSASTYAAAACVSCSEAESRCFAPKTLKGSKAGREVGGRRAGLGTCAE